MLGIVSAGTCRRRRLERTGHARPVAGSVAVSAREAGTTPGGAWQEQRAALGGFIRSQRKLARLSLRQLAALSNVSNPYLSQLERGLHVPSVRVLYAIAEALDVSAETLMLQAGLVREQADTGSPGGPARRGGDRKSTRLNSSHSGESRMPSSA